MESNLIEPGEAGSTLAKIHSRLLSSKILAAQVSASVHALKFLIDPSRSGEYPTGNKMPNKKLQLQIPEDHGMLDLDAEVTGWEPGTINGRDCGDNESDGAESSMSDRTRKLHEYEGVSSEGDTNDRDSDDEMKFKSHQVTKAKSQESTSNSQSTFLPSLSVGFIKGSDDSDFDEAEAKEADMPRKNRRGQRARRA